MKNNIGYYQELQKSKLKYQFKMEVQEDSNLITDHNIETESHWAFLVILFISYFIADQVYIFLDNVAQNFMDNIEVFTGDYTYAVIVSVLILASMKISSMFLLELNIEVKPQNWVWISGILILSHPITFDHSGKNLDVKFEIFGMIQRSLNGSNELFIFLISSLILVFASFGGTQMLLISERKYFTHSEKFIEILSIDYLPIFGILFSIIYLLQSLALSEFEKFDYSQFVKIFIYILFSHASIPNISTNEGYRLTLTNQE